jgi:hypothetical protein
VNPDFRGKGKYRLWVTTAFSWTLNWRHHVGARFVRMIRHYLGLSWESPCLFLDHSIISLRWILLNLVNWLIFVFSSVLRRLLFYFSKVLFTYQLSFHYQLFCNICSRCSMLHCISMSSYLRYYCTQLNLEFREVAHLVKAVSSDIWDTIYLFLIWGVIWSSMLSSRPFSRRSFRIDTYLLILLSFKVLYLLFEQNDCFLKVISAFLKHL